MFYTCIFILSKSKNPNKFALISFIECNHHILQQRYKLLSSKRVRNAHIMYLLVNINKKNTYQLWFKTIANNVRFQKYHQWIIARMSLAALESVSFDLCDELLIVNCRTFVSRYTYISISSLIHIHVEARVNIIIHLIWQANILLTLLIQFLKKYAMKLFKSCPKA